MKTVYYDIIDEFEIVVVDKEFWDNNGCWDDGSGINYINIMEAMEYLDCWEVYESVYEITNIDLESLEKGMWKLGFNFIHNPELNDSFDE